MVITVRGLLPVIAIACMAAAQGQPTGRISGVVVDRLGAVITDAHVEIRREGELVLKQTTSTDESGGFSFEHLPPGTWMISVSSPGFNTSHLSQTLKSNERVPLPDIVLDVDLFKDCGGGWYTRPHVSLERSASHAGLSGAVEEHNGPAVDGAKIVLSSPAKSYFTRSGLLGEFRFRKIPPGLYTLTVSAPGYEGFLMEGLEVRQGYKTIVDDALSMRLCPTTVRCNPARTVERPATCL
jgi:hypothetical protein